MQTTLWRCSASMCFSGGHSGTLPSADYWKHWQPQPMRWEMNTSRRHPKKHSGFSAVCRAPVSYSPDEWYWFISLRVLAEGAFSTNNLSSLCERLSLLTKTICPADNLGVHWISLAIIFTPSNVLWLSESHWQEQLHSSPKTEDWCREKEEGLKEMASHFTIGNHF